jgi:group II intron reverse transcriptase/maturase
METKLTRIAEVARTRPKERLTSLIHLIDETMLVDCHHEMDARKATGVDKVTKEEYDRNLVVNLQDLLGRMKRNAYKPQPVRRVYIPKPGSDKKRPLGIPGYEDKLVQTAVAKICSAIWEEEFLDCSYGFRPKRGCHDALKRLSNIIEKRDINYVVDADIRGFFDHVDHEWMMKFVAYRIADPNLLRLIARFFKAGVVESGIIYDTPEGTPQGGVISPILANIYLHYVLDLWFEKVVKRKSRGEAYLIRYADDFICCFQYEDDAKMFYQELQERLSKFKLEIATEKTRLIAFGRKAVINCTITGKRKPGTFDFLGFTHYCGKSPKYGTFTVMRKTSKKKYKASLLKCKEWIKQNRHMSITELIKALRRKLIGYYQYYGVTGNYRMLDRFRFEVIKHVFKWLNRRSQRKSFNWSEFGAFRRNYPLPVSKIYVHFYGQSAI